MPMKQKMNRINLRLDYHSHILPGCDHGSDSVETSMKQIESAKNIGIETICATAHFYPNKENLSRFLSRREKTYNNLCSHLDADSPKIKLGAEVLICPGLDRLDGLESLCLQGTTELLLEMPFYSWTDELWDTLYSLNDLKNIQIVMAHADRYSVRDIESLIDDGFTLQLNAECLTKPIKRGKYLSWIDSGAVKYLGSDMHMLGNGYKDFEKAVNVIGKH